MINIVCVGKIKEDYLQLMINDYRKRINKYHKLNIIELKDSNIKDEGDLILKHLNPSDFIVTMEIEGKMMSSLELAKSCESWLTHYSTITFVIGGSNGIDARVKKLSKFKLSFGLNTYPHGLFRAILLEQIYRTFKILNNETYHK